MTLHQFTNDDINLYETFVQQHANVTPYHTAAWGLAVEEAYGFAAKYFGLYDNDELVAVLPTVQVKSLSGKAKLCSLPYCDLGGALALTNAYQTNMIDSVTNYANENRLGFEYRASAPIISTDSEQKTNTADVEFSAGAKVRMLYTLCDSVEAQLASFKPKLRSQIKKSIKNGISSKVISSPSNADIQDFYHVFATNMKDLGSPVHSIQWFTQIFEKYKSNAFLVLVKYEDTVVGGGIVIYTKHKAVIPWASTMRDYNKLAPNMLLYWEVLSEAIRRDINTFDFGRSGYNEGTYRFKKQWGALPLALHWQELSQNALVETPSSDSSAIRETVEKVWQKLPLAITVALGPRIRKYISL